MQNQVLETIQRISGMALRNLVPELSLKETRKDYSRAIIDAYLNKVLSFNYKKYLSERQLILKTTPIKKGGLTSIEPMRLCSINLINLANQNWVESDLNLTLNGILIIPLIVEARNLGQPYRKVGQPLIWIPNKEEVELIHEDWLMYKKYACLGAVPRKRGVANSELTYPAESSSKFIHMKPHSVKGKFELDSYGNEVRKMAFYLNPSRLRSILLNQV